jgi:hypothetical protein
MELEDNSDKFGASPTGTKSFLVVSSSSHTHQSLSLLQPETSSKPWAEVRNSNVSSV